MGKHDRLFITELHECADDMVNEGEAAGKQLPPNLSEPWALMRAADVPEATAYVTTSWIHPKDGDERVLWVHEHEHDYDEILMFLGADAAHPGDLGGTIFMTIDGEEHTLTTTSSVFIPRGVKHCPLGFHGVERPIRFIAVAMSGNGHYIPARAAG